MLVNAHKLVLFFLSLGAASGYGQNTWSLQKCIDTALVHNKQLKIQENTLISSDYRAQEAKLNYVPKLFLNADYKYFIDLPHQLMPLNALNPAMPEGQFREVQFGVPHNLSANVQFAMPLYNPQLVGGIEMTDQAKELAALNYQKSQEEQVYEISMLYHSIQLISSQLQFVEGNKKNAQSLLKNMQLLHEQLMVTATDVNKVKLQVDQLETQQTLLSSRKTQLMDLLKVIVGVPSTSFELEPISVSVKEYQRSSVTPLDLQLLGAQNKLLKTELRSLNYTRYTPSLNLVASYGLNGFGYDKKPNDFFKTYQVGFAGLQFTYPLFGGMTVHQKMKQKKLELLSNELKSELVSEQLTVQINNAERQQRIVVSTMENTQNQLSQAQQIYDQVVLHQQQGLANLTTVLLADNALREAQQNHLNALVDYLKADLDLRRLERVGLTK